MHNTSIYTADRTTHLKIVAMSLICATIVTGISVAAHVSDDTIAGSRLEASVIRAGAPVTAANNDIMIR